MSEKEFAKAAQKEVERLERIREAARGSARVEVLRGEARLDRTVILRRTA